MKTFFIFLVLLSSFLYAKDGSRQDVASEQCDLIEMNHFYDDQERLVFIQFMFYDYKPEISDLPVLRAWRMSKHGTRNLRASGDENNPGEKERWQAHVAKLNLPAEIACKVAAPNNGNVPIWTVNPMLPVKDHNTGLYAMTWQDGDVTRKVTAKQFRTSYTTYDPELTNREILPKEKRRELISPKVLTKGTAK